jgi:hypothetical protein
LSTVPDTIVCAEAVSDATEEFRNEVVEIIEDSPGSEEILDGRGLVFDKLRGVSTGDRDDTMSKENISSD